MKFHSFLLIFVFLLFSSCSSKGFFSFQSDKVLINIGRELSAKLGTKLSSKESNKINYIRIIKKNTYLKIIISGDLFDQKDATPFDDTKYILEYISSVINSNKNLYIRVYGHSFDKKTKKQKQDFSDYLAINVAEIIYNSETKNEILAKGCSDQKKQRYSGQKSIVEIYIYTNLSKIQSQCR